MHTTEYTEVIVEGKPGLLSKITRHTEVLDRQNNSTCFEVRQDGKPTTVYITHTDKKTIVSPKPTNLSVYNMDTGALNEVATGIANEIVTIHHDSVQKQHVKTDSRGNILYTIIRHQ